MQYRQLGKSGLLVSELCFGAMSFGARGYWEKIGGLDQEAARRLVDIALDAGVNFFDKHERAAYFAKKFGIQS